MPNPPTHIDIALVAVKQLGHEMLNENISHFVLGATSPDIRSIVNRPREQYHFATLDFNGIGSGVRGMFSDHPELADTSKIDVATVSFIAGYITHILLDESWITEVYRPVFGNRDIFSDSVQGGIADRALQLELDRQTQNPWSDMIELIEGVVRPVAVPFIDPESLEQWRSWLLRLLGMGFSWDRLKFMAKKIAKGDENHPALGVAEEFLSEMPKSLVGVFELTEANVLNNFRNRSIDRMVNALEDYLS